MVEEGSVNLRGTIYDLVDKKRVDTWCWIYLQNGDTIHISCPHYLCVAPSYSLAAKAVKDLPMILFSDTHSSHPW